MVAHRVVAESPNNLVKDALSPLDASIPGLVGGGMEVVDAVECLDEHDPEALVDLVTKHLAGLVKLSVEPMPRNEEIRVVALHDRPVLAFRRKLGKEWAHMVDVREIIIASLLGEGTNGLEARAPVGVGGIVGNR